MKITVLAVGKLRDAWARAASDEYLRRLRGQPSVSELEVKSVAEISRRVPARARLWVLDPRGVELASEELAARLKSLMDRGESGIALVIGGADGLPEEQVRAADFRWSLGKATLPHRLARIVVLEQIYRALTILRGQPYHRA